MRSRRASTATRSSCGATRPGPPRGCGGVRPADAGHYAAFDRLVRSLSGFLGELAGRTPPDIETPGLGDALAGLQLGRTFRGLGRDDGRTITRVLPMAIADFVAESFETDAVRAAIAWRGVQYTAMGPWSAGTTAVLLADSAGNDGGAAGQTVFARGGPGALVDGARRRRRSRPASRSGPRAEVTAITSRDGRATGVVLADGDELAGRAVVAGIDPKRALTGLADPVAIGPQPALAGRQHPDAGHGREGQPRPRRAAAVHGRRRRHAAPARPDRHRPGHRRDGAGARCREVRSRRRTPPIMEATIPSLVDPSLVDGRRRTGTHVMSVIVQSTPYKLRDGTWDDARDGFGDLVVQDARRVRARASPGW